AQKHMLRAFERDLCVDRARSGNEVRMVAPYCRLCEHVADEARVRKLEYTQTVQIFLPHDHPLIEDGRKTFQKYLDTVKAEGPQHERGPPELQIFGSNLSVIASWLNEGTSSPAMKRFKGVPERLLQMLPHTDGIGASEWVKECTFSPTYDQKKTRITVTLLGQLLVGLTPESAETLLKEQADAWGSAATDPAFDAKLQRNPLEVTPIPSGTKCMNLNSIASHILREWGGEMAKILQGKK
ncbi:unnamed protein product, partial [Prorocentrum cordatum]